MLRLCLIFLFSFFPPPYLAHFPHGHGIKVSTLLLNQQQQISGTVTDSYGPMPGVHVLIKGTHTGTFTDQEGQYSLLVNNGDTLVFSYLGYHSRELPVLGRTTLDVEMRSEVTELQEVEINAGYYTVKERERKGNGVPGTAASIRIRGQNSLRNTINDNGNLPLFIIDGIPINSSPIMTLGSDLQGGHGIDPLNTLNLSNIESIEVLKDADATAIYGSRGANGIVLITTKRGKETEEGTSLDVSMYSGIGKVSNTVDLLNTVEYLQMRREAFANDGITSYPANAYDINGTWDQNRYTDWQKELLGGTAFITNVQTSLTGGNRNTSFLLGGAFHKEGTVFPGDFHYQKVNGSLNINHISQNERFKANISINYGIDRHRLFRNSFVGTALTLAPNAPALYDENGELNWENSTWNNPLSVLGQPQNIATKNLMINSSLSYEILSGMDIKVNFGYTDMNLEEMGKRPKSSFDPADQDAIISMSEHRTTLRNSLIIEPQLTYDKKVGNGYLEAIAGATVQENINNTLQQFGRGYVIESLIGNLGGADETGISIQEDIDYVYAALFGRIGFKWDKKYFINLTGRRDGSSRFGPNNRFANFGAIGAAWIFSEEQFIKDGFPILSFGKLRGSYGLTGSDQIPDYGYSDTYQPTMASGGLYPTQLTNPDYSWEVNRKLEASLELGFLEDRIKLSTAWYRNRSSNQLVGYSLSALTGFSSVRANLPATVQNTGWEFELMTRNLRSDNFTWETSANISFPRNTLVDFPNIEQTSYFNTYRIGEPLNIAILYRFTGVNPETGLYEVEDVDQDGRFDVDDQIVIKDRGRRYYGGINNNITYKGLQLNFLWEFVQQTGLANQFTPSLPPGFGPPFAVGNVATELLGRWREVGDNTDIQRYTQSFGNLTSYNRAKGSDVAYNNDASFIRLKTLTLAYQLPHKSLSGTGMEMCKIYLHSQNLLTFTKYSGLDPQFPGGNVLPSLRMLTLGIQIKF